MQYQVTSITTTTTPTSNRMANLNSRSRPQQWSRLNRGQRHCMYIRRQRVGYLLVFRSQRSSSGLHMMRMAWCKILAYRLVKERQSAEVRYFCRSELFSRRNKCMLTDTYQPIPRGLPKICAPLPYPHRKLVSCKVSNCGRTR